MSGSYSEDSILLPKLDKKHANYLVKDTMCMKLPLGPLSREGLTFRLCISPEWFVSHSKLTIQVLLHLLYLIFLDQIF